MCWSISDHISPFWAILHFRDLPDSGKIPNNSVVWVTLAEKGTYDGYTMIGAIVDWPTYPVFVSAPQHAGDGRIFTRIGNYSNEQNTISCTFYIYFVKNGAIKDF